MTSIPQRTAKAKGNGRMVTGICRLSFPSLFKTELDIDKNDTGKYATALLIDKGDTQQLEVINQVIEEAKKRGISEINEWRKKWPIGAHHPLGDGDTRTTPLDGYEACYYLRARTKRKPTVLDQYKQPITEERAEELVYAGAYAVAVLDFYPFYAKGKSGIGVSLSAVQVLPGGERFGGGGFDDNDFEAEEANLSDDDL